MPRKKFVENTYPDWETAAQAAVDSCPRSTGSSHAHLVNIENWLKEARDYLALPTHVTTVASEHGNVNQAMNLFRSIVDDALEGVPGIIPSEQIRAEREANLLKTLAAKQHDYGHDNILWAGVDGVIVRMHDKIARLKNLQARSDAPDRVKDADAARNESIYDSWLDIAGYGVIALMLLEGTFTLDLRADLDGSAMMADFNRPCFGTSDGSVFDDGNRILEELSLPLEEYTPLNEQRYSDFDDRPAWQFDDEGNDLCAREGFEDVEPPNEEADCFDITDEPYDEDEDSSLTTFDIEHGRVYVQTSVGESHARVWVGFKGLHDSYPMGPWLNEDELNDLLAHLDDCCEFLRHLRSVKTLEPMVNPSYV